MKLYFNREVLSWSLYDFANSAFATTILAVVFNVYFVKVICAGGVTIGETTIPGESFWGYTISCSMFIVFFLAPILGAVADLFALKKKLLLLFCALGSIFTGLLAFCVEGDYWIAALFFMMAHIGFSTGNVFYNALLQEIATTQTVGRVSGFGWGLGYLGGGLLLALNLALIDHPEWFNLSEKNHIPVRASLLSVSLWWAFFSIPIFLWVKEKKIVKPDFNFKNLIQTGLKDVNQTLHKVKQHKEIFKFLIANLIYNDGIQTVILMASIFGAKELGMSQKDLILCFLMIQGVALFGSLIFGNLADKISHKICINITLLVFLIVCTWAMIIETNFEFWILGAMVGLVLGGSQSVSRSFLALLVPKENNAQFFGFFALTEKLATVIGPFVFAILTQLYSLRVSIGSLVLFFLSGLVILHFVQEPLTKGAFKNGLN